MNFRYSVLSNKERNAIVSSFFSEKNIATEFFITTDEINRIKKFDRSSISLGYALQYLFLKARGISILNLHEFIPASIINHVAEQLHCNPSNLRNYWNIRATKSRHFQDICKNLSYRKFSMDDEVERLAYNIALSTGSKFIMVKKFIEELNRRKIILPTISTIEELISKAIATTDDTIYKKIYIQLENKDNLDKLLNLEKNGISSFSRIKNTSVNISSSGVKELLKLIKEINEYGNNVDLSFLSENKVQYFSTHIQRYDKFRIEKFRDNHKKYSYLAMFLYFKRKEFMDMVIEVMSNHAHAILKRGKKKTKEYNIKTQSKYKTNAEKLKVVVSNILEISNFNELKKYQNSLGELKNELDSQDDDLEEIDFLLKSYQSIDYLNDLLEIIEFDSNTKPELIKFLRQFNDHRNRKKNKTDISSVQSTLMHNFGNIVGRPAKARYGCSN
ncbi:MAG TPA: DUF4158 domain-containing protein [Clostridiales bacterium]|nr:DUF4158 domain-containing protein [Clostridiales bacterium]